MELSKNASEHLHQVHTVAWFRRNYPGVTIFAIPNGGKRGKIAAVKLKAEGVLAGVPDLCVPKWGLFIEMKKPGGTTSKVQKERIAELEGQGLAVLVCKSFEEAKEQIADWANAEIFSQC